MTSTDADFDTWLDTLSVAVLDKTGIEFRDADSVRADYQAGRDAFDVADEIALEYGE